MELLVLFAAVFLPLFPFSAVVVSVAERVPNVWLRALLYMIWPQVGLVLLSLVDAPLPDWLLWWALVTSVLYAFRVLVIRQLSLWLSFMGVSSWSLLWIVILSDFNLPLFWFALGFSLPLVLMALLGGEIERRFQAAYAGLYGGISLTQPRLSAMLVFALLAVIATPLFPGFFTMVAAIMVQMNTSPLIAVGLLLVWFLWSWSGILLLQGLVMGPVQQASHQIADLDHKSTALYSLFLFAMLVFGLQFMMVF